ncbi:hypothetical protein [Streptomyces sp. NPDC002692]
MLMYLILTSGLAAGTVAIWHRNPRIRRQAAQIAAVVALVALWHWGEW